MSNFDTKFILANRFIFDPTCNLLIDKEAVEDECRLGSNESRILFMFVQHPNKVITRNELHNFVWREQGFEVDDSSLTQAISTLRKILKDSTKAPLFIKTVPKRGYQLIASVEVIGSEQSKDSSAGAELADDSSFEYTSSAESQSESQANDQPVVKVTEHTNRYRFDGISGLMILSAIILPLLAFLLSVPPASKFRNLAMVDDVVISAPINHPDLSSWLPLIESCVKKYRSMREEDIALNLQEVIATGGDSQQLMLNYIHSPNFSHKNITLRIFADADDTEKVCR